MHRTVDELLDTMSAEEYAQWQRYYELDPWGEARADLRAGIVASTLANAHRASGRPPYRPADFMPYAQREEPQRNPDPMAWFKGVKHGD